jgi:diguanylate cyclase (GGDEF)-like protein
MDKFILKTYIFFFILACIFVGVYASLNIGIGPESMFPQNTGVEVAPLSESSEPGDEYMASFDASEIAKAGGCLSFTTIHKDVRVYEDGELIYEYLGSRSLFMRSNGNVWNAVRVSDESRTITVDIKTVYGEAVSTPQFIAGDYYNIRYSIAVRSTPALLISLLDIISGIAMVLYFSVIGRINKSNNKLLPFGITAILIGIWSAGETNAMVILLANRTLASVIAYMVLIFIPIPYVMYIKLTLWPDDKWIYRIPMCLCLFDFVLVTGLALSGTLDLKHSVIYTHMFWAIAILYVLAAAVRTLKRRKIEKDENALFNCAAMLILIAVASVEIGYYWTGLRTQNDILGRSLIFAYIAVLGFLGIRESIKDIENGRMAEYYRKLANTDSITGLANRTAFNQDIDELKKEEEYSIISIDLNDLKTVNDTKGHQAGDRYIINAARILSKIFGNDGTCYRIGGDEFCVLIKKSGSDAITGSLISEMEKEIIAHNKMETSYPVSFAWGYESNIPSQPRDYSEIMRCADEKMYENKRLQKGDVV